MKIHHYKQVVQYHHWNQNKILKSTHHHHQRERLQLLLIHQYKSKYHQFHQHLQRHFMDLNHQPHIPQIIQQENASINA